MMQPSRLSAGNSGSTPLRLPAASSVLGAASLINVGAAALAPQDFSPLVAHQLSNLIVRHWYACMAANELSSDSPLDILDFLPGHGMTTLLMTQMLQRKLPANSDFRWRYLPVFTEQQDLSKFQTHEGIRVLLTEGRVLPLLWPDSTGEPMLLSQQGSVHWQPKNPVVVLFHDYFSYLSHRLLAVHYGKLMEYSDGLLDGQHELEEAEDGNRGMRWVTAEKSALDNDLSGLFDTYVAKFNSAPIPYPQGALRLVDAISQICEQGCLMVAAARGVTSELRLRLTSFDDLTQCFKNNKTMPVNFHLIAHKLKSAKAVTDHVTLQKDKVLHISLFMHKDAQARVDTLVRDVDPAMFGHASALSQAMQSVNGDSAFEHRLTLLKLAAFDPHVLAAIHGPHFSRASKQVGFNREGWFQALDRVWSNYLPSQNNDCFHEQLASMAMHCGHWALARRALQSGLRARGPNAADLVQLAWCDARTGFLRRALATVNDAVALDPTHLLAREVRKKIEERLADWDNAWRQPVAHPELPLILEPLDISHADAMIFQYRDPQIAIMTGLPALTTLEEMQQWIAEQLQLDHWAHYAIMHTDRGFVGYINLAVSEHAAFFCFWTGVDFQGRGLATEAGKLACEFARQLGISVILTSAYSDNQRSIRALERIGFAEIPIRALPPDHERIFYVLSSVRTLGFDPITELKNYYLREKITLKFPYSLIDIPNKSEGD